MRVFTTCAATDAVKKGGQKSGREQRTGNSSGIVILPSRSVQCSCGACVHADVICTQDFQA